MPKSKSPKSVTKGLETPPKKSKTRRSARSSSSSSSKSERRNERRAERAALRVEDVAIDADLALNTPARPIVANACLTDAHSVDRVALDALPPLMPQRITNLQELRDSLMSCAHGFDDTDETDVELVEAWFRTAETLREAITKLNADVDTADFDQVFTTRTTSEMSRVLEDLSIAVGTLILLNESSAQKNAWRNDPATKGQIAALEKIKQRFPAIEVDFETLTKGRASTILGSMYKAMNAADAAKTRALQA